MGRHSKKTLLRVSTYKYTEIIVCLCLSLYLTFNILTTDNVIILYDGIHLKSAHICVSRTFNSSFVTTHEWLHVSVLLLVTQIWPPKVFNTLKWIFQRHLVEKQSHIICLKVYPVYLASRTISCQNNIVEMDNISAYIKACFSISY